MISGTEWSQFLRVLLPTLVSDLPAFTFILLCVNASELPMCKCRQIAVSDLPEFTHP